MILRQVDFRSCTLTWHHAKGTAAVLGDGSRRGKMVFGAWSAKRTSITWSLGEGPQLSEPAKRQGRPCGLQAVGLHGWLSSLRRGPRNHEESHLIEHLEQAWDYSGRLDVLETSLDFVMQGPSCVGTESRLSDCTSTGAVPSSCKAVALLCLSKTLTSTDLEGMCS